MRTELHLRLPADRSQRPQRCSLHRSQGTTLLELMIAVALFTVISGVAFSLMYQQQNASQGTQGQVALNMALRNTESLLQMDLANAGNGYYQTPNMSNNALGVSITNNVVTSGSVCYTTVTPTSPMMPNKLYGVKCFDQLNIVSFVDPSLTAQNIPTPVLNPSTATYVDVSSASSVTATIPASYTGTAAQAASAFHAGDYLLFLTNNGPGGTTIPAYTVVPITSVTPSGNTIIFGITHTTTNGNGSNSLTNDPFDLSTCDGVSPCPPASVPLTSVYLTNKFYPTDYILKIVPVSYQVCNGPGSPTVPTGALYTCDQSTNSPDINNPKLWRIMKSNATQGVAASPANCSASGTTGCCPANYVCSVVMEQVLGFKVGATIWNAANAGSADVSYYDYDASSYTQNTAADQAYNFSNIVSVRISLIGRTAPAVTQNYVYKNSFDGGPYQVQGMALVVNPRNMNQQNY